MSLTLQSLNNTKELEQFSPRPFVAFKEKVRKMSIGNIDIIVNKKTSLLDIVVMLKSFLFI